MKRIDNLDTETIEKCNKKNLHSDSVGLGCVAPHTSVANRPSVANQKTNEGKRIKRIRRVVC